MSSANWRPQAARQFSLEIDGERIGTFSEVQGLQVEVETEPIEEGGENQYIREVPGRMKWPHITLKRPLTDDAGLFEWFQKSSGDQFSRGNNKVERKSGTIAMLDESGGWIRSWDFVDVFPVKWTGPTFAAGSTEVATEEIELVHHGFTTG